MAGKAIDVATMQLRRPMNMPDFASAPAEVATARYTDPHIEPWSTYHYREVARAPGSSNGVMMWSETSLVVKLTA
jgi:hypothetical protein